MGVHIYSDSEAARLYDVLNSWAQSDEFYLKLAMAASSVLDVGCGTGRLLHRARVAGHSGRLVGIDPDRDALDIARGRSDIEWVEGTAASMGWDGDFNQAIMMSHAFQCLVTDDHIRPSLAAIRRSLVEGGKFTFETRNPAVRAWEKWTPDNSIDVVDPAGRELRITYHVDSVAKDVVTFTETTGDRHGTTLRIDRATLRFLDAAALATFLDDAGFVIDAQYGGWSGEAFGQTAAEIITVAKAA